MSDAAGLTETRRLCDRAERAEARVCSNPCRRSDDRAREIGRAIKAEAIAEARAFEIATLTAEVERVAEIAHQAKNRAQALECVVAFARQLVKEAYGELNVPTSQPLPIARLARALSAATAMKEPR